ncbi:hypothetical protein D3C80_1582210 [compost metagenome]
MHALGHIDTVGIATGEQHGQQRAQLACFTRQYLTAHVRQTHIGHHQCQCLVRVFEHPQRGCGVFGFDDRVAQLVEHFDHQHTDDVVIFDYQKVHGLGPVQ